MRGSTIQNTCMKTLTLALIGMLGALICTGCGGKVLVEGPPCEEGLVTCNGQCIDLEVDAENCGACGVACDSGTCSGGECAPKTCPVNENLCNGVCTDINSDPNNCGGCNIVCSSGACDLGTCSLKLVCGMSLFNVAIDGIPISIQQFNTVGVANQWDPSCGPSGEDAGLIFVPPISAEYHIDSLGTSTPTTLEILNQECFVLACAATAPNSFGASMSVYLEGGKPVLLVADTGPAYAVVINIDYAGNCQGCGEYISSGNPAKPLCSGSEFLYNNLVTCICDGACSAQCQTLCQGGDVTKECQGCVADSGAGCGNEFNACGNDF
ncbi:MAG: hypothetical protein IPK82_34905 [Polyangiaceae bacterium]|nr:hypothetical protein [Polyangiaceae bacterium]